MSGGPQSSFVYVTYIRTTAEKLWRALIEPEFTKQFWFGVTQDCEWKAGAPWRMMIPDGRVADAGEVVEIERIAISSCPGAMSSSRNCMRKAIRG
jgi:uncharacterized protein YndB with AHSA1/START domain